MSLTANQQQRLNYLKRLIALRIDEYTEGESVPDIPVGDLDIELENAVRSVISRSSRSALLGLSEKQSSIELVDNTNSTIIPLSGDYVRFIQLRSPQHDQPVIRLTAMDTRNYKDQVYTMTRATASDPMGFLIPYIHDNSKKAIELFPKITELTNQGLMYVPETKSYDMPVEFEDAIVWRATMAMLVILRSNTVNTVLSLSEAAIAELEVV